jgi:hypothetical protein
LWVTLSVLNEHIAAMTSEIVWNDQSLYEADYLHSVPKVTTPLAQSHIYFACKERILRPYVFAFPQLHYLVRGLTFICVIFAVLTFMCVIFTVLTFICVIFAVLIFICMIFAVLTFRSVIFTVLTFRSVIFESIKIKFQLLP